MQLQLHVRAHAYACHACHGCMQCACVDRRDPIARELERVLDVVPSPAVTRARDGDVAIATDYARELAIELQHMWVRDTRARYS
jgi:urocanate hydratase